MNEGATFSRFFPDDLVNEGKGTNKGIEFTFEKFFSKNYYILFTGSLFDSKYKGSDGIERNTSFNGKYITNLLAGKDYKFSERTILTTGFKITLGGGKRYSPADTVASNLHGVSMQRNNVENLKVFE